MVSLAFLCASLITSVIPSAAVDAAMPAGQTPQPIPFPHFPSRAYAFVWRNWTLVSAERLAEVLETTPDNVRELAESMGLPTSDPIVPGQEALVYITLVRRNWHLLPYNQLLVLLNMSPEEFSFRLREDDFLFIKLGNLKPACAPLKYTPPNESEKNRATEIKRYVTKEFGDELKNPEEKRFAFLERLSKPERSTPAAAPPQTDAAPHIIYPYFSVYGDTLMDDQHDPFPDGMLQRLSDLGVNGVWIHVVLRQLAPSPFYPEFGEGSETRLANLNKLVQRAGKYGVGVYLYMNEPRAMPLPFFEKRPEIMGVREGDFATMCTSVPQVRQWMTESLAHVFQQVPDLAGVFTITGSENLTSCASHYQHKNCPRCAQRTWPEIIAEVNTAIEEGVHRGNPKAKVLAWDWGWPDEYASETIQRLPPSLWLMSVSEWSKPFERGGVKGIVGEYAISVVGPGPRALKHWQIAKGRGLKTVAKVQFNNTWELSAVPYIPVMDLIAEHCSGLSKAGVDGIFLSWTLGGYPSPNLRLARYFELKPDSTTDSALNDLATENFGADGAGHARKAWTAFSEGFREFPYCSGVIYQAPFQFGPANLLSATPTGYKATMVGFPYDDLDSWRGPYPAEVFADQLEKVAAGFERGLPEERLAVEKSPNETRADAEAQLRYAQAAKIHFQSTANQTRFCEIRNSLLKQNPIPADIQSSQKTRMRGLLEDEILTAKKLFSLSRQDSRIGYEASNHYFYVPIDLMEKAISCQYILEHDLK